jgi:hypothetical protein
MNREQLAEVLLAGLKKRAQYVEEIRDLECVIVDGEVNLLDLADEVLEAVVADLAQRSREGMARNAAKGNR